MDLNVPWITICGCGPGALEDVPSPVHCAIETAEVLVGAERLLDLFPRPACPRIPVQGTISGVLDQVESYRGRSIAVLVTGDPGLCSIARQVISRFGRRACRVIPALSAIQVACARLALDWSRARVISYHGRIPNEQPSALASHDPLLVLAGSSGAETWAAALARTLGDRACIICEDLTLPTETIRFMEPDVLTQMEPHPRRVIVLSQELRHG